MALVIGSNRLFTEPTQSLHHADDDAIRYGEQFRRLHPEGELFLMVSPDGDDERGRLEALHARHSEPTRGGFVHAIQALTARANRERASTDRSIYVQLYFAGHGGEARSLWLEDAPLYSPEIWSALNGMAVQQIFVLLDRCFPPETPGNDWHPPEQSTSIARILTGPGHRPSNAGYIDVFKPAAELERHRGGVMTALAINGLLGMADLDRNQRVTFHELGRYIRRELEMLPGSTRLEVVPPERDPLAVIGALAPADGVKVRVARSFPTGIIQVWRSADGQLVLQRRHRRGLAETLTLAPGRYDFIRLLEPNERVQTIRADVLRVQHVYAISTVTLEVRSNSQLVLDRLASMQPALLGSESVLNRLPQPSHMKRAIGQDDERLLSLLSARRPASRHPGSSPASVAITIRVDSPYTGLKLGTPGDPSTEFTPGGAIRLERTFPLAFHARWYLGGGTLWQYGVTRHRNVAGCRTAEDQICNYPEAFRHQGRVGGQLVQAWLGPSFRLSIQESVAWSPSMLTSGRAPVLDYEHDIDANAAELRYSALSAITGQMAIAFLLPVGFRLELGPILEAEIETFNPQIPGLFSWQVAAGLAFRQSVIR